MPPPQETFVADRQRRLAHVSVSIPVLNNNEIITAAELGQGGFCRVMAVRNVKVVLTEDDISRQQFAKQFSNYKEAHYSYRHVPGQHLPRMGDPRKQQPPKLALKRLKSSLNKKRYALGAADLNSEVSLLANLRHPNIITVYGVGYDSGSDSGHTDRISFVLLDQLRCTLKNKLYMWRERRGMGMLISRSELNELWLERTVILMRIASAVEFLHANGVAHRDLHPHNIGFDGDDTPKLFDFGLARVVGNKRLPPGTIPSKVGLLDDDDAKYQMTGNTGTIRYMAPEIALGEQYGLKVDVYSLAIVFHEVLSLLKPFANVSPTTFTSTVSIKNYRPSIDACWPDGIKHMMNRMWDGKSANRPPSREIVAVLESLLRGSDDQLYPKSAIRRILTK